MSEAARDQAEQTPSLTLLAGQDAQRVLTDDVIAELAASLHEGVTSMPAVETLLRQTPEEIHAVLCSLNIDPELISGPDGIRMDLLQSSIRELKEKHVTSIADHMRWLRDKGCMIAAVWDRQVIGCAATIEHERALPGDALPPFEIKRVTVLPEFRRKGFSQRLLQAATDSIDPARAVMAYTKTPAVSRWCEDHDFHRIPLRDAWSVDPSLKFTEDDLAEIIPREEALGWRAYARRATKA